MLLCNKKNEQMMLKMMKGQYFQRLTENVGWNIQGIAVITESTNNQSMARAGW